MQNMQTTTTNMPNMQTTEFLHLLGHSSGSAGSWDVFRGRSHHPEISGKLLWRGVLSRAGWGLFCVRVSVSSTIFGTCWVGHFELHMSNLSSGFFVIFVRQLLDVTYLP